MNLTETLRLYGMGTSEGAEKGWDTRGRGRHEEEQSDEERDAEDERKANQMTDPRGIGGGRKMQPADWKKGERVVAPDGREGEVAYNMGALGAMVKMDDGSKKVLNDKHTHYEGWRLKE